MRYFAMIDGERRGPYELEQLSEAGVGPQTYVWCKEMEDWEKAEDVAEICRYFRQRIFDITHSPQEQNIAIEQTEGVQSPQNEEEDAYSVFPPRFREMARQSGIDPKVFQEEIKPDANRPISSSLFLSVMMTLFCFPFTGIVAIYYAYKARAAWVESRRSESKSSGQLYSDEQKQKLLEEAHENDRQAKMWMGITFFLGFILYAFLGHKFL